MNPKFISVFDLTYPWSRPKRTSTVLLLVSGFPSSRFGRLHQPTVRSVGTGLWVSLAYT